MANAETDALSYEDRLRRLLDRPFPPERAALVRAMITNLIEMHRKYGVLPDSTPGIREERDRRG